MRDSDLIKACEEIKQKIRDLKSQVVDDNHRAIHEIQLKSLQDRLSDIGRQLQNLNMYRKDVP